MATCRAEMINSFSVDSPSVKNAICAPTIRALKTTGDRNESNGKPLIFLFLNFLVKSDAKSVAIEPKIISTIKNGLLMFPRIHPTKSPKIAAGVKIGIIANASEARNCTPRYDIPKIDEIYVKAV